MERSIQRLISAMAEMTIIDAHEHMPSEATVNSRPADIFTHIFAHYTITTAMSAGGPDREFLHDLSIPVEKRWKAFSPYLDAIRDSGYARAAQVTARELYGIDDINDSNYLDLQQRLQERNKPGLFDWIFDEKCHIETVLNQGEWMDGISRPVLGMDKLALCHNDPGKARLRADEIGIDPERGIGDFHEFIDAALEEARAAGYWGIKIGAPIPVDSLSDEDAFRIFLKFMENKAVEKEWHAFNLWVIHYVMRVAPKYGFVVASHCGICWCNWADFSPRRPTSMIPLLEKYRETRFDLYHAGIPYVREMAVIANSYPNAHVNLCWCHQISPHMTEHFLNEWIDLIPTNKIIAFGGDNPFAPEKTYGALVVARENIARALAVRIKRGTMTEERAVDICRDWCYNNPKRIYGL